MSPSSQAIYLLVRAREAAFEHMLRPGEFIPEYRGERPRRITWDDADRAHRIASRAIEHLQKPEVSL